MRDEYADKESSEIHINVEMIIKSIGFQAVNIAPASIPWENKANIIKNVNGCVLQLNSEDKIQIGKYCVGWIKTGPVGLID